MAKTTTTEQKNTVELRLTIAQQQELFQGLNEISNDRTLPLKFAFNAGRNAALLKACLESTSKVLIQILGTEQSKEKAEELMNSDEHANTFLLHQLDISMLPKTAQISPAFFALCRSIIVGELK